jgi:hypothetical protein
LWPSETSSSVRAKSTRWLGQLRCRRIDAWGAFMSVPPGQPQRPAGPPFGVPQQYPPTGKRAWPRRHPIWSAAIAIFISLVVIGASASNPPTTKTSKTSRTTATAAQEGAAKLARPKLVCHAEAGRPRPRDHTAVMIRVDTVADAQVTAIAPGLSASARSVAGRASAQGVRMLRFLVGGATPGARIAIVVNVSRNGQTGTCQASFRPRAVVVAVVKPPAQPTATPSSAPAPPPAAPAPPPATASSCYPLSDEGTCYEPGEFCRDDDHGVTGLAGDGETITCEDNDGWRWEPS